MTFLRLRKNETANVSIILAVSFLPICAVCGLAVDFDHTSKRKMKVQAVLDASVLAAARVKQSGATDPLTKASVHQFLQPQIAKLTGLTCTPPFVTLSPTTKEIIAEISCEQDTTLSHVVGQDHMPFRVRAASSYSVPKLDVAFMFDASGSMRSANRLVHLKSAVYQAIDVLLPDGAAPEVIENTRVAMTSYASNLNAGPFFEKATGVPERRTYYHNIEEDLGDDDVTPGRLFDEMHIGLYDADTGSLLYEFGDNAVLQIKPSQIDDLAVAVTIPASSRLSGQVESMRLKLTGPETADATENVPPYSLYGDSGLDNLTGERWQRGDYRLRLRAYENRALAGRKRFDKTLNFEIFLEGDTRQSTLSHTITSSCVWERNTAEAFSDAAPGAGNYHTHHKAWFEENSNHPNGGVWKVGFEENGRRFEDGGRCLVSPPVELTNDRNKLRTYVSTLRTEAYTAGHLGVAWAWYLISDRWNRVFDGAAAPASFTQPGLKKAVILMTDGGFNHTGHRTLGESTAQARTLCDRMKSKGILIYSVAFSASASGQEVLKYCATTHQHYHQAENRTQLESAYKDIAVELSELRISQ
ncbi:MAG: hypothetical protein AAFR51_10670 [Pseudomonadota bacterium]